VLAVTGMDREKAVLISRSPQMPAMDAPEEILAQAIQGIEQHMGYARTRYRTLKAKYDQRFRQNLVSRNMVELGRQIESGRAAALALQTEKKSLQTKAARAYQAAGIPMPNVAKIRPEQIEGAERLGKILAEGDDE